MVGMKRAKPAIGPVERMREREREQEQEREEDISQWTQRSARKWSENLCDAHTNLNLTRLDAKYCGCICADLDFYRRHGGERDEGTSKGARVGAKVDPHVGRRMQRLQGRQIGETHQK
jgi:hypothetical protein